MTDIDWSHERTKLLPKSGVGVVAPWLVIAPPNSPVIRLDLRMLDSIRHAPNARWLSGGHDLTLVCGELEVALYVADGLEAVQRVVEHAAPLTRAGTGRAIDIEHFLFVGNDEVSQRGDTIQIGRCAFETSEVRASASRGADLPLHGGSLVQAAIVMLVVAAAERAAPAST